MLARGHIWAEFFVYSLARSGRVFASEKHFVKCAENLVIGEIVFATKSGKLKKINTIKLARLLRLMSVGEAHPCSKR